MEIMFDDSMFNCSVAKPNQRVEVGISVPAFTKEDDFKKFESKHSFFDDDMLNYLLGDILDKKAKEIDEKLKALEKKSRRDFIKSITNSIREVKFHDPYTIIFWKNGDVTRIKCQDGDTYDKEKGFAIALLKYFLGENTSDFNTIFKKWVPEDSE